MKALPEPSRRRLVLLGRLLAEYGGQTITSQEIEARTGWSSAVIRKDISLLGKYCGASNGYKAEDLRQAVAARLCPSQERQRCCIVGLGRMGQALLDASELDGSPFMLVAGFDSSVNRTEILRSAFPLHPTTMLESIIQAERIRYAILAAPPGEAQALAGRLAESGIRGIVNYTPCVLTVPPAVAVENVGLLLALETLVAGQ